MPESDSSRVPLPVRCAIYTRKSTEEGLDKEFNSLEAQREAAEAYIRSQQTEGWVLLPEAYDDGGFTGANMARPALRKLFDDIESGRLDCVVVYKVDRLSRSLVDFARMMGEFEKHGTTFVSVTQQFNTSTPVGRLTLHILLSFAQFEREIISERTRDKKAAAKRKGKWTGGYLPLGYDLDINGGRLVVNRVEAKRIEEIFDLFIERKSLDATIAELDRREWKTKSWVTRSSKPHAGTRFTPDSLRRLLQNETYLGKVFYRGQSYRGEHPRIVDPRLWKRANALLASLPPKAPADRNQNTALLKGLLRCSSCGQPMSVTATTRHERRYRYYVCRSSRTSSGCSTIAAQTIETAVLEQLDTLSSEPGRTQLRKQLQSLGAAWQSLAPPVLLELLGKLIEQVSYDARTGTVTMRLRPMGRKRR